MRLTKKYAFPAAIIIGFLLAIFCLPRNFFGEKELFTVLKGENSRDIAINLQQKDVIWWGPLFRLYVLARGIGDDMQAGVYRVSSGMSILVIAEHMASGKVATETITIPEGFTAEQIWQKLQVLPGYNNKADVAVLQEFEGMLFPDTYKIPYGMELEKVALMMVDNFWRKNVGLETTHQTVVMASILEKELQTLEDKEIAAGILWKRISVGMPMQVDAFMWTYQNTGLPAKAICNPGLDSIKAALYPKDSAYWFYLSTPQGQTIFSKTYAEHLAAKAKYLK